MDFNYKVLKIWKNVFIHLGKQIYLILEDKWDAIAESEPQFFIWQKKVKGSVK
jgi:hypothetical protein